MVYLLLSTPGGSVMHGMNLYNVLRGMPFELITHNVGNVDSIGNAVFLAGAKRYAAPHSTFMFHGVGFDLPAQTRLEEKFCRFSTTAVRSAGPRVLLREVDQAGGVGRNGGIRKGTGNLSSSVDPGKGAGLGHLPAEDGGPKTAAIDTNRARWIFPVTGAYGRRSRAENSREK